jgi:hypothetical protein
MNKTCTNCKLEKSLDNFGKHRKNGDGLNSKNYPGRVVS